MATSALSGPSSGGQAGAGVAVAAQRLGGRLKDSGSRGMAWLGVRL
jgi:hypothetical protein